MSQVNNNIIREKGQHIRYSDRKLIDGMLRKGFTKKEIAQSVGIAQSTLSAEIRRGEKMCERVVKERELKSNYYRGKTTVIKEWAYDAKFAQADADVKRQNSCKHFKIFVESGYVERVEQIILSKKKYSPDIASALARSEGYTGVSTKTLYNWIEWGLMKVKPMDLLLKVRRKKATKIRIQKRTIGKSIDERPKDVEKREEFGHWEGDSIIGKEKKGQIITLVERKNRVGLMFKFNNKKAKNIVTVLRLIKKRYGTDFDRIFKSITFDNGSEFAYNKKMSKLTTIYYAHAYSSWERGSNENFNGIVRRFIPKSTDITKLKQEDIDRISHSINTMPRRLLEYKTPLECFRMETSVM